MRKILCLAIMVFSWTMPNGGWSQSGSGGSFTPLLVPLTPSIRNMLANICLSPGDRAPAVLVNAFCNRVGSCASWAADARDVSSEVRDACVRDMNDRSFSNLSDELGMRESSDRDPDVVSRLIREGRIRVNTNEFCLCLGKIRNTSCEMISEGVRIVSGPPSVALDAMGAEEILTFGDTSSCHRAFGE